MTVLNEFRRGFGRLWENISEEWAHFVARASKALTRFTPLTHEEETAGNDPLVRYTPRLGILASEVLERDNDILVRLEVPGLEKENLRVTVHDNTLLIQGDKHMQREERHGHYHLMECAYGSFRRAIPLPSNVEIDAVKAKYRNGVLNVTLPKTAQGRRRKIAVETD